MMKQRSYRPLLIVIGTFLGIGMLFYAWYNEIFILRIPSRTSITPPDRGHTTRKNTKLLYYQADTLKTEEKELLHITNNNRETIHTIITAWLNLLDEERVWPKRISLKTVFIDASGSELFLTFDQRPFLADQSIYTKLLWAQALLKTIEASQIPIKTVRFLVHNKPLQDIHLDFSHAWPISGYIASSLKK